MRYNMLMVLLFACTLFACNLVPENETNSDIAEIAEQMDVIEDLANTGVSTDSLLKQYIELFIDEPVLLPPGRSPISGYDSTLSFYMNAFNNLEILNVSYQEPKILIEGNMAVRRFSGTTKIQVSGQTDTLSSSSWYLDVLRKQPDGKWRIVWHSWGPMN